MRKLALPIIAALTLTACGTDSQDNVTVMTTVTDAADAPAGEAPDETAEPAEEEDEEEDEGASISGDDECANPDATIEDSGLYDNMTTLSTQWGDFNSLPTDSENGFVFLFKPAWVEDHFDPCLPLSWAVLGGSWGDERGPGGTGGSGAVFTAFFHYDKLISDPAPSPSEEVMEAYRIDDTTIRVIHGRATGPRAFGINETYSVDHVWRDGRLVAEGADAAAYEAYAAETGNLAP